jgi:hypothetical protein
MSKWNVVATVSFDSYEEAIKTANKWKKDADEVVLRQDFQANKNPKVTAFELSRFTEAVVGMSGAADALIYWPDRDIVKLDISNLTADLKLAEFICINGNWFRRSYEPKS